MTSFDSFYVLSQLQDLEQQIALAPRRLESLRLAYQRQDREELLCQLADNERLLGPMAVATARIKEQVVAVDGLGSTDSLFELMLRGVRMVVLTDLALLRDVAGGPIQVYIFDLPGDQQCIEDLAAYVEAELHRITQMWLGVLRSASDRMAFRLALRAAARAMERLGKVPQVERFLRDGVRRDWPVLAAICAGLRAAFDIRLHDQPDRPLLIFTPRMRQCA